MTTSAIHPDWQLNDALPNVMISTLNHLGLMKVTGEDNRKFMQGQVSSDIENQPKNAWRWGAHCDPKGKMIASFRSFYSGDDLFLLMPKDSLSVDLPQLQKYAVFSKAELIDATKNWQLLGVAGSEAALFIKENLTQVFEDVTLLNDGKDGLIIKDNERYLLMLTEDVASAFLSKNQHSLYDETAWKALEVTSAYPNIPANLSGQYIPQMCNLQAINGICFTKGCYMGQETIARIKYRGGNKRALYLLTGQCQQTIDSNTELEIQLEDNYRKAGNIIEFVQRGTEVILTAVLANDTALDAKFRLSNDEQSELGILPLPYSLEE